MDSEIHKIFALFREIEDKDVDMELFGDRINLQKLTYILKDAGLSFDYHFNWYVRGPYSPSLSDDAFKIHRGNEWRDIEFSPEEKEIINTIKESFSEDVRNSDKLELYASILFIKNSQRILLSETDVICDKIKSLKPWFTKEEVKIAIEKLRSIRLLNT